LVPVFDRHFWQVLLLPHHGFPLHVDDLAKICLIRLETIVDLLGRLLGFLAHQPIIINDILEFAYLKRTYLPLTLV